MFFIKKRKKKKLWIEQKTEDYKNGLISDKEYLFDLRKYAMLDKEKTEILGKCFYDGLQDALAAYDNLSTIKCRRSIDLVPAFEMCYQQKITLLKDAVENMSLFTGHLEKSLECAYATGFTLKDIFCYEDNKLMLYEVAHIMMENIKRGNKTRNESGIMLDLNGELMFQNKINEVPTIIPNLKSGAVYIDDKPELPEEVKNSRTACKYLKI